MTRIDKIALKAKKEAKRAIQYPRKQTVPALPEESKPVVKAKKGKKAKKAKKAKTKKTK